VKNLRWLVLAAAAALAAWIGLAPGAWQDWLGFSHAAYFTTGQNYAFFSGFGAWLSSTLGLSAIILTLWHHINCRADGCPRIGHYPDSRGLKWCWRHHPDHHGRKPTTEMLHRLHFEHKNRTAPPGPAGDEP